MNAKPVRVCAAVYMGWLMLVIAPGSPPSVAAEPNLAPDKPNIWGVWIGTRDYPDVDKRFHNTPFPPVEFTPWGVSESKRLMTHETPDACKPSGPMGHVTAGSYFPMEIARAVTGIVILYEVAPLPRRIHTDGRKHPEDLDPTWLGHSIGHWEGDTLVIDTVGTNGRGRPLNGYLANGVTSKTDDAPRLPVSEQLHMVERIRLVGDGQFLENEITIDDPKTYTRPFTVRRYWIRRPDLDVLEYFCEEGTMP